MSYTDKFNSFIISLLFSIIAFGLINIFILRLSITDFIIIEIIMAILQIFSNFVKVKAGLLKDQKSNKVYD